MDPRWKAPGSPTPGSAPQDGPARLEAIPLKEGGSTLILNGRGTFEDLARIKDNKLLQSARPEVREQMVSTLIGSITEQITATTGYTKEAHLRLEQAAAQAHQDVAAMTTLGDRLRYAGNVVVEAGKSEAGSAAALAADAIPTQPDGSVRLPFGNTAQQSTFLAAKAKDTAQRMASPAAEKTIDAWLDTFCSAIKNGDFPFEPQAFGLWIRQQSQSGTPVQRHWYDALQGPGDPATKTGRYQESYTRNNSLDAPENLQLIQEYFKTHDPALLEAFKAQIKKTPQRARTEAEQDASLDNNQMAAFLTDLTGRDAREDIKGLPGAVGSHLVPAGPLARLGKGSRAAKNVARGVRGVGSIGGNMVQTLIENPDADFEDHKKAAVENFIASVGMRAAHGTGRAIAGGAAHVLGTGTAGPSIPGSATNATASSPGTALPGQVDPSAAPSSPDVPEPGQNIPGTTTHGPRQQPGTSRLQFSLGRGSSESAKPLTPGQMMQVWAAQPGRFRRDPSKKDPAKNGPASTSPNLDQIFSDYDLHKEKMFVEETNVFRDHTTDKVYHIGVASGGNAYLFLGKDGTAWLDLKEMRSAKGGPAQGGDLVVQAAMTYAINNGLRWRPDPSGSSDIAVTRGFSHMLSSALRHQSTQHLAPNSTVDPETGELKIRIPGWKDGTSREAYEHNVNLLATAEYNEVKAVMEKRGVKLDELDWDPKSDTVTHGPTGRRLSEGDIEHLVSRLDPGNSGIGETTLSRALGAQAALQGKVFGGSDTQREGPALSDGGGETPGDPGTDVFRIRTSEKPLFYSQPGAGDGGSGHTLGSHFGGDTGRLNQQVAETTRFLHEKHSGLINDNTQVFHSADDLINSDYAKQHPFSEEEKAAMRGAEGFFDASTGKTVIIAGNVGLRGGETPQSALTRVVLHERVGHDGLKLLLDAPDRRNGRPGINRARWDDIRRAIPDDDLKAIGKEEGYKHLKDNPEGLALEWFARKAESSPELLKQNSALKQMWQKFTEMVQDVRAHLGMDPLQGKDLDTQVIALLSRARKAAVKGGGKKSSIGGFKSAAASAAAASASPSANAISATSGTPPAMAGRSGAAAAPGTNAKAPASTASLARPPLDVVGSKRLIANVRANAARRPLHPVEQADLAQAERIVAQAQAAAQKPPATLASAPLSVEGSRRLIANVMAMPERQRQHPRVQADLTQAMRIVAEAMVA